MKKYNLENRRRSALARRQKDLVAIAATTPESEKHAEYLKLKKRRAELDIENLERKLA